MLNTGIVDNSNATAITIDSSENVTFAGAITLPSSAQINASGALYLDSDVTHFRLNNETELMRIQSSGVGIGTNNPAHKLDVTGSIQTYASGSGNAWLYTKNDNKIYLVGTRGSSPGTAHAFSIYDLTLDKSRFRINSDGGVAIGEDNAGYAGQILSIKAGSANTVLYGESTDADCHISLRDNSSNTNVTYGCVGNNHTFANDGSTKWTMDASNGYLIGQSASQVRIVLGSTGSSSNNTSNWVRGTGSELGLNSAGGNVGIEIGGSAKVTFNPTGQILANPLGVTVPTFSFIGDTNTGMTRPTGDTLQFITAGEERLRLDSVGNVGIGMTPKTGFSNQDTLQVLGPIGSGRSAGTYAPADARIFRDWFVYAGAVNSINRYVHMKTDLWAGGSPNGNTEFTMSCFRYHSAYAYGSAKTSEGMIGWHNWSGAYHQQNIYNPNSDWEIVKASYTSSDGYVVLVADILAAGTYACFSVDWHQWGGYTLRQKKVTAVSMNASATGAY